LWAIDSSCCRNQEIKTMFGIEKDQRPQSPEKPTEKVMLIWKDSPPGFEHVMYAEASGYCCTTLYWIIPKPGGFVVVGRWAIQHAPIIDGKVFATLDEAKAAGNKAFAQFRMTKFWSITCDDDAVIDNKRERHHELGCRYANNDTAT
jgi:hypothetical protein